MSRIGITGHSNIAPESVAVVTDAIREVLRGKAGDSLTGVTCLARGADQIFARVVIELGGTVEVVLPAHDYRERVVKPENAAQFDELIEHERYSQLLPAKSVELQRGDDSDDVGKLGKASSIASGKYLPVLDMGDASFDGRAQ